MQLISFSALGTEWIISIDSPQKLLPYNRSNILAIVTNFEEKYSRFKPTSFVSKYNAGEKIVDKTFLELQNFGEKLSTQSEGYFTLQSGAYLGALGYGNGVQGLDFGAFGKGWLIDTLAQHLKESNFPHFFINAGGDIFATQKNDGSAWNVALEHPKKKDFIFGIIELKNSAIAGSSPYKRVWNSGHHLINGKSGIPTQKNRSVFTKASSAKVADALATCFSVLPVTNIPKIAQMYNTAFLLITNETITHSSSNFTYTKL